MKTLGCTSLALALLAPELLAQGQWSEVFPATQPPSRLRHSFVQFPGSTTGEMLLFGGKDCECPGEQLLGDQWKWTGTDWAPLVTATSRTTVEGAVVSYDPIRDNVVSVTGWTGGSYPMETWIFDGVDWTLQTTTQTPPGRDWAGMATHPVTGESVLFGGHDWTLNPFLYDDTWTWDGTDWTLENPANRPLGRNWHAMSYDGNTDTILLFGGSPPGGPVSEMWSWDGSDWTQLTPPTLPPARSEGAMAWDPDRGVVVLSGGWDASTLLNDTWEWDGTTWTEVTAAGGEDRASPIVYDTAKRVMRYFGGSDIYSFDTTHSRTWEYASPWTALGFGLAGSLGEPTIGAAGAPTGGSSTTLDLGNAKPVATAYLVAGTSPAFAPIFGGTLVPFPKVVVPLSTDSAGEASFTAVYGPGSIAGIPLYFQYWVVDGSGPQGFTASPAVTGTAF